MWKTTLPVQFQHSPALSNCWHITQYQITIQELCNVQIWDVHTTVSLNEAFPGKIIKFFLKL